MFYKILKIILIPLLKVFFRIKVSGKENEPECNYITCANHSTFIDPLFLAYALKQQQRFVARSTLIRFKFYRWLFRKVRVITINRGNADITAIRTITASINEGDCVGIFPQGTRMKGVVPQPNQAQAGIGLMATMTNVPVLPVSIVTKRLCPGIFRKTKIVIGKAIPASEYLSCCENPRKKEIAEYCFSKVCIPFEGMTSRNSGVNHD